MNELNVLEKIAESLKRIADSLDAINHEGTEIYMKEDQRLRVETC